MADNELGFKVFEGICTVALGEGIGHGISHSFHFMSHKVRAWYLTWRRVEAVIEADVEAVEVEAVEFFQQGLWFWDLL